jgi:ATP-dependent Clp protease adaptor protein ClpS
MPPLAMASSGSPIAEPEAITKAAQRLEPLWRVILHDDQLHTYEYVIEMLMAIFAMDAQRAYHHAIEVDTKGTTVLARLPRTEAEKKRDAIMRYGGDHRMRTTISMVASIEPEEG